MGLFSNKVKYLPATILCSRPYIIACFFEDFQKNFDDFVVWYSKIEHKYPRFSVIFLLGFQYETQERMGLALAAIDKIKAAMPKLYPYFLCNSKEEQRNFLVAGKKAVFCSQNAFLRESRYGILDCEKIYDAFYLARITPFKRHELVTKVPRLLLVGDYTEAESEYAEGILKKLPSDAVWIRRVQGVLMYKYMNKAKVGLCLSEAEGAMYACAEYGLCGLPVITTENLGGRENSISPRYTFRISKNPTPEEVAEAVDMVVSKNIPPRAVREATLDVLKAHRGRYASLISAIFRDCGETSSRQFDRALNFPHKFGVRCKVTPWFRFFNTVKILP